MSKSAFDRGFHDAAVLRKRLVAIAERWYLVSKEMKSRPVEGMTDSEKDTHLGVLHIAADLQTLAVFCRESGDAMSAEFAVLRAAILQIRNEAP